MNSRIRHQIGLELFQIHTGGTVESQRGRDGDRKALFRHSRRNSSASHLTTFFILGAGLEHHTEAKFDIDIGGVGASHLGDLGDLVWLATLNEDVHFNVSLKIYRNVT